MKKLLLAAGAIILGMDTAAAQDATYDWSGAYVGVQIGHAWGDVTATYPIDGGATAIDPDGWLGGAYFGYNHHLANGVVLGIDADIVHADISGTGRYVKSGAVFPGTDSLKLHWSGAVRGRAGYAMGRFLPYLAGGVAFSRINTSTDDPTPAFVGSWDKTYFGYTVGAGAEYAVADNVILRSEYRYSDFGKSTFVAATAITEHTVNLRTHEFRLGIAYKF